MPVLKTCEFVILKLNVYIVKVKDSSSFFPTLRFHFFILPMIKKYSLLVTLYQYVKQLRMDRNRKEINLLKQIIIRELS